MIRLWRRRRNHEHDPLVCREFVELVSDYLDDALDPGERARFEAHLAECDGCAGYLEDMRRMVDTLHRFPELEGISGLAPDPETREVLLRAFRDVR